MHFFNSKCEDVHRITNGPSAEFQCRGMRPMCFCLGSYRQNRWKVGCLTDILCLDRRKLAMVHEKDAFEGLFAFTPDNSTDESDKPGCWCLEKLF